MKPQLIKTQNYLLMVVNEEINVNDWCIDSQDNMIFEVIETKKSIGMLRSVIDTFVEASCLKILAHLPLGDAKPLEGLSLIPPAKPKIEDKVQNFIEPILKAKGLQDNSIDLNIYALCLIDSYKVLNATYDEDNDNVNLSIEKLSMDLLKDKWAHLYVFGYPQKPFPTNYENDLKLVMLTHHKIFKAQNKDVLDSKNKQ